MVNSKALSADAPLFTPSGLTKGRPDNKISNLGVPKKDGTQNLSAAASTFKPVQARIHPLAYHHQTPYIEYQFRQPVPPQTFQDRQFVPHASRSFAPDQVPVPIAQQHGRPYLSTNAHPIYTSNHPKYLQYSSETVQVSRLSQPSQNPSVHHRTFTQPVLPAQPLSLNVVPPLPPYRPQFYPQHDRVRSLHSKLQGDTQSTYASTIYDPFSSNTSPSITQATHAPIAATNPYSQEGGTTATSTYYQTQSYNQPAQYHLYTSLGPHKEALLPYQRSARDFFIPEDLREDLQRKSAAQLQTLQNTNLPQTVDYFHSLVPLDINNIKNVALFGYPTWLYKAVSTKDGHVYALRRIEGFRLANDRSIKAVQAWRRVNSGSLVSVVDSFTTRAFGDSSLIIVYDYFPLSKTLADTHLQGNIRAPTKTGAALPSEVTLWSYIVQIANALKAIHSSGLAARSLDASKIIISSRNRIRLSSCGILDALQLEGGKSLQELQREDLILLGHLILNLASGAVVDNSSMTKVLDTLGREKSPQLKERTMWLLNAANSSEATIDVFLSSISNHLVANFDAALHQDDILTTNLSRELENSRIVRLMTKLNFITERPDFNMSPEWSETGERYPIKLFRDYVFHQVDAQNNPVLNLAHVISCLNKLDAASDEKIQLTGRDDQTVFIVSFKEMKRACESAFGDLVKASRKA